MPAAKMDVLVEPMQSGKVTYLPMAPVTSKAKSRGRVMLRLEFTNKEAAAVKVTSVKLSFPGSSVPEETKAVGITIGAGKSKRWWMGEPKDDVLFDLPGPTKIRLSLACQGFSPGTVVTFDLAPHKSPVAGGAYRFPAQANDLGVGEFWSVNGCTHGVGAEGSQSFAYDMGVWGADHATGTYSGLHPGKDGTKNDHHRIWGEPVRAMADGVVLEVVHDCPNNPAPLSWTSDADLAAKLKDQQDKFWGSFPHGGAGNHLYVQHGSEVMLYAHLQKDSIPAALRKANAKVTVGTTLGKAGNSGNSTAPHLHIHAIQGTAPESGPLRPIVLTDTYAIDNDLVIAAPQQGWWSRLAKKGIPEGSSLEWWVRDVFISPAQTLPEWPELVHRAVPETKYQTLFDSMAKNGFRPVWIDGYTTLQPFPPVQRTFFNVIFRPAAGVTYQARHGLDGTEYQAEFETWVEDKGYRPVHVESYWSQVRSRICYAALFVKSPGPATAAYHGRTKDQHQALLDDLTGPGKGFRPVAISVVSAGGERRYTALYEKRGVGTYEARSALSPAEYQSKFDENVAAGRKLVYLNAYQHGGQQLFVGIWHQQAPGAAARHHLDDQEFEAELKAQRKAGRYLRGIAGYQRGAGANYAAMWGR